ncbi:hypothetical protein ACQWKP_23200, partial [Salmonella enterica subsp. enterica serovar Infantis]
ASIDLYMWFLRPFYFYVWVFYSVVSSCAFCVRCFVRGEFYSQDGALVASTVQEGVMRYDIYKTCLFGSLMA